MKVSLFDNPDRLKGYLKERGEAVTVLSFDRDLVIDQARHRLVFPKPCLPEEKLPIIEAYVEAVSEIGDQNGYSLAWLCHPISEKNELMPENLLDQLVDFLAFHRTFGGSNADELAVISGSSELLGNIAAFCQSRGVTVCSRLSRRPRPLFLRRLASCLFSSLALAKKILTAGTGPLSWKKLDRAAGYSVIRTWFDQRSAAMISQDKDTYFGELPGRLKAGGRHVLYYGEIINADPRKVRQDLGSLPSGRVLLERTLLGWADLIRIVWFTLTCRARVRLSGQIMLQGVDVGPVFRNYMGLPRLDHALAANYATYLAAKKLVNKVQIKEFFNLYENYSWEKVTNLAVKQSGKRVRLIAFQHAQIAASSTKFFLGKKESERLPLPDKIITLGEVTSGHLVRAMNYPAARTVAGCALRHSYGRSSGSVARPASKRVLVFLWTFERSLEMLRFIKASRLAEAGYDVVVSPHPNHPYEKLKPYLGFDDQGAYTVSRAGLKENIDAAMVVVYSGTTTCLDALASGRPVISVDFNDFIDPDPLFGLAEFKWTVSSPEALSPVVKSIEAMADADYYSAQAKAMDFVGSYFRPVDQENLKVFLN
ncbi:MAG: hypothetical protein JW782_00865 [Candidatus Saganbacteria bacterium]|nr:hypothetical protein [Candidatus Saganbacteria bacterium]